MTIHPRGFDFLKDVDVRLSVELGRTNMTLKDVLALGEESVVMLDRLTDELLDVMVNGKAIAKGEVVADGGRFGLRIVELLGSYDIAVLFDMHQDVLSSRTGSYDGIPAWLYDQFPAPAHSCTKIERLRHVDLLSLRQIRGP